MRKRGWLVALTLAFVAAAFVVNRSANSNSPVSASPPSAPTQTDTQTAASVTTNAAGQTIYSYRMPGSATPTSCTVYLQGHAAEITFSAPSLNVEPACRTWVQSSATSGELWVIGTPPSGETSGDQPICHLETSGGNTAHALVLDQGGAVYGQEACTRLLSAGAWFETQ